MKSFASFAKGFPPTCGVAWKLFIFLTCFYLLFMNPSFMGYDVEAYLVAESLIDEGSVALSRKPLFGVSYDGGVPGLHGKHYSRSGVVEPVLVFPFYAVGALIDSLTGNNAPVARLFLVLLLGPLLGAAAGVLLYLLAAGLYNRKTAVSVAAIYSLCTMAFPYSNLRVETVLVVFLLLMIFGLVSYGKSDDGGSRVFWAVLAGMGAGASIAVKSYALLLTLPGWIWFVMLARRTSKRHIIFFFVPVLFFGLMQMGYNTVRFGSPLDTGYSATFGFGLGSLISCLYVLFLSPAKSIFIFCPILLIGIWSYRNFKEKHPALAGFIIFQTFLLTLFISTFREPLLFADEIWGSRYLFPVVCLWTLTAGLQIEKGGAGAVAAWGLAFLGFAVSLPGVFVRPEAVFVYSNQVCAAPIYCRLLEPSMNAVIVNAGLLSGAGPGNIKDLTGIWIWWVQVLHPSGMGAVRVGEIARTSSGVLRMAVLIVPVATLLGMYLSSASILKAIRRRY